MHQNSTSDRSMRMISPSVARRVRLSRRQRALLGQWQALGALTAFLGLLMGLFASVGAPALSVAGGGLLFGAVLLAPPALMALSARVGRCRLAAAFGLLGVLLDSGIVLLGLVAPYDGYPLLEQIARVLMCYATTGVLAGAAVATFGAARALWEAGSDPRWLGPGSPEPDVPVTNTRALPQQAGEFRCQLCTLRLRSGSSHGDAHRVPTLLGGMAISL